MRSGAADAKAEVFVERPVPPPQTPKRLRLSRRPLAFCRAERAMWPKQLSPQPPEPQHRQVSLLCQASTWRPYASAHHVQAETPKSFPPWGPAPCKPLPRTLARLALPFPRKATRAGNDGRFLVPACPDLYIGRSRFVTDAVSSFPLLFKDI